MAHPFGVVTNSSGVPVSNATINIHPAGLLTNLTIYSDAALTTTKANPFAVNADGSWDFYIRSGQRIRLRALAPGATLRDEDQIAVGIALGWFDVKDFGATGDGVTDDTVALQAAINAAKAVNGTLYAPAGIYVISRLDLTGISGGMVFEGAGQINATRFMPLAGTASYGTATGHLFDCTGSAFLHFSRFQVGAANQVPVPTTAFFLAQVASGVANAIHFDSVYVTGLYTAAALYVYKVPSSDAENSDFYNYQPGAGTFSPLKLSDSNVDALSSSFAVVAAGGQVTANWWFGACEFHKFAGAGANGRVLYLDGCKDIHFNGGVVSGGAQDYVDTAGVVARVTFDGVEFETESEPVTPTNVIGIAATGASDVVFRNCLAIATTFMGGAGSFDAAESGTFFITHISAGTTFPAGATNYMGAQGSGATEANEAFVCPFAGALSSLRVRAAGSPGQTPGFTYTVMLNGVATALVAVISAAAVTATDLTHYVNVLAGDLLSVRAVTAAAVNVVGGHTATFEIIPRPQAAY